MAVKCHLSEMLKCLHVLFVHLISMRGHCNPFFSMIRKLLHIFLTSCLFLQSLANIDDVVNKIRLKIR